MQLRSCIEFLMFMVVFLSGFNFLTCAQGIYEVLCIYLTLVTVVSSIFNTSMSVYILSL